MRARLLGEHLHRDPEAVAAAIASERSLIRAIEKLNTNGRRLAPFSRVGKGSIRPIFGTRLIDPARSSALLRAAQAAVAEAPPARRSTTSLVRKSRLPIMSGTRK